MIAAAVSMQARLVGLGSPTGQSAYRTGANKEERRGGTRPGMRTAGRTKAPVAGRAWAACAYIRLVLRHGTRRNKGGRGMVGSALE